MPQIVVSDEWKNYCDRLYMEFSPYEGKVTMNMEGRVNKYYFWEKFLQIMPETTTLALGNSSVAMGANQIGRRYKGQRMISNYICGSMGYDLPAAIGVAVAAKKDVICVTGDGSIMMNLQELQTIKYKDLPVKVIVLKIRDMEQLSKLAKTFWRGSLWMFSRNRSTMSFFEK